jgi:hypothetical protein
MYTYVEEVLHTFERLGIIFELCTWNFTSKYIINIKNFINE